MAVSPKRFPLDRSPAYWINRLARDLAGFLHRSFLAAGFDVTAPQWAVLNRLWEEEGLHQSDLAARIVRDRHNLARIIWGMEKKGLIRREADPRDKRLQRVYLTQAGRDLQDRLVPLARRAAGQALAGIPAADLESLQRIYDRVMENLDLEAQS